MKHMIAVVVGMALIGCGGAGDVTSATTQEPLEACCWNGHIMTPLPCTPEKYIIDGEARWGGPQCPEPQDRPERPVPPGQKVP